MEQFGKFDCKSNELSPVPLFLMLSSHFLIVLCVYSLTFRGDKQDTRGTAFVVYEDIYDAKNAVDHLSGFNVCNRYLIVLYYQQTKMQKVFDNNSKRKEIDDMKAKFGIKTDE